MRPYRVLIDKRAESDLLALPKQVVERFAEVFLSLEEDPYRPQPGCDIRIVKGHPCVKAIRVGRYRGIYEVRDTELEVRFTKFGHRDSVYH
jgi:mRNA-degrading endonuclease RelE of RelBE toxin-antitoxin system